MNFSTQMLFIYWIFLFQLAFIQCQDDCPRNKTAVTLENRDCRTPCETKSDCRNRRASCSCDGACGLSCIAPGLKCSKPPDPENGKVISQSLVFGSKISYQCDDGYELIGSQESVCNAEGSFTGKSPICVIASFRCPPPPFKTEKSINDIWPKRDVFFVGEKVTYSCQIGFFRKPGDVATTECVIREDSNIAEWYPEIKITCIPKQCSPLPPVANAVEEVATGRFGDIFTYQCKPGYRLRGNTRRQCGDGNQWTGSAPTCEALRCPDLETPENGNVFYNSLNYGSSALFECDRRFYLEGKEQLICTADGEWSEKEPQCIKIDCGQPPEPVNGHIVKVSSTEFDGSVTYRCNQNTKLLSTVTTAECKSDRKWSSPPPICMRNCKIRSNFNGSLEYKGRRYSKIFEGRFVDHGSQLILSCNLGYEIPPNNNFDDPIITEQETECNDGALQPYEACIPARCPCSELGKKLERFNLVYEDCSNYALNNMEISLKCHPNFPEFHGTRLEAKCIKGQWSIPKSQCTLESCSLRNYFDLKDGYVTFYEDGKISRGKSQYGKLKHGGKAMYSCNDGYEIYLDNEVQKSTQLEAICQRGYWNIQPPVCKPARCLCHELTEKTAKLRLVHEDCWTYAHHDSQFFLTCHKDFPEFNDFGNIAKCSFGVWNIPKSQCTLASCSLKDYFHISNGDVTFYEDGKEIRGKNQSGTIKHGGRVSYQCINRYEMHFGSEIQKSKKAEVLCQRGEWNKLPPVCKPARCSCDKGLEYLQSNNLEIEGHCSGFAENKSVFKLHCSEGFPEFRGSGKDIECMMGIWKIPTSYCAEASCGVEGYHILTNGKAQIEDKGRRDNQLPMSVNNGARIKYSCEDGFELSIRETIIETSVLIIYCKSGEWSEQLPVCKPGRCPCRHLDSYKQSSEIKMNLNCEGFADHNTVVEFECEEGYTKLTDEMSFTCSSGTWRGENPICQRNAPNEVVPLPESNTNQYNCELPEAANGKFRKIDSDDPLEIGTIIKNSSVVRFECNEGYKIAQGRRTDESMCVKGVWKPAIPTCTPIQSSISTGSGLKVTETTTVHNNRGREMPTIGTIDSEIKMRKDNVFSTSFSRFMTATEISNTELEKFQPYSTTTEDWSFASESITEKEDVEVAVTPGGNCLFETIINTMVFHNGIKIKNDKNLSSGDELNFRCKDIGKFLFTGKNVLKCVNGRWNDNMPSCTELSPRDRNRAPVLEFGVELDPYDIEPDGSLVVFAGDTLTLDCLWFKYNGDPVWIFSKTNDGQQEKTLKGHWNELNNKYQFVLTGLTEDKSGIYYCKNPKTNIRNNINVRVTVKETPTTVTTTTEKIPDWSPARDSSDDKNIEFTKTEVLSCIYDNEDMVIQAYYQGRRIYKNQQINHDSEVVFFCPNATYSLTGTTKVLCYNGKWSLALPRCLMNKQNTDNSDLKPSGNNERRTDSSDKYSSCFYNNVYKNIEAFHEGRLIATGSSIKNNSEITVRCQSVSHYIMKGPNKVTCNNGYWSPMLPKCDLLLKDSDSFAPPIIFSSGSEEILEDGTVFLKRFQLTIFCFWKKWNHISRTYREPRLISTGGCPLNPNLLYSSSQHSYYQVYDVSTTPVFEVECGNPDKPQLKHKIVFKTTNHLDLRTPVPCQKCLFYNNDDNMQAYYKGKQISNNELLEDDSTISLICPGIFHYILRGENKLRCDKGIWTSDIPKCEQIYNNADFGEPRIEFSRRDFQIDEDGTVIFNVSTEPLSVYCFWKKYNYNSGQFQYPIFDVSKGQPSRSEVLLNQYPYRNFFIELPTDFEVRCANPNTFAENRIAFKFTYICIFDADLVLPNTRKKVFSLGDVIQVKCLNPAQTATLKCVMRTVWQNNIDYYNAIEWQTLKQCS